MALTMPYRLPAEQISPDSAMTDRAMDTAISYIELIDVDVDGNQRICDRRLVVHKRNCPFCNQQMDPMYDNGHEPIIWQECPTCGFVYDMRCHDEAE